MCPFTGPDPDSVDRRLGTQLALFFVDQGFAQLGGLWIVCAAGNVHCCMLGISDSGRSCQWIQQVTVPLTSDMVCGRLQSSGWLFSSTGSAVAHIVWVLVHALQMVNKQRCQGFKRGHCSSLAGCDHRRLC